MMPERTAPEVSAVESPWLTDAGRELRDRIRGAPVGSGAHLCEDAINLLQKTIGLNLPQRPPLVCRALPVAQRTTARGARRVRGRPGRSRTPRPMPAVDAAGPRLPAPAAQSAATRAR